MGTRFRCMLTPVGVSTGDKRRFALGSISTDRVPLPLEWARVRDDGHDGAVTIGVVENVHGATVGDAVRDGLISSDSGMPHDMMAIWADGQLFDDADPDSVPRLVEDVTEVMTLVRAGTLGASVDLDWLEATLVVAGTNMPPSMDEEQPLELLITSARIRAATLVAIPAMAETSRAFELMAESSPMNDAVLVASTSLPSIDSFSMPTLDGPTLLTVDRESGAVFGHAALWQTCHRGFRDTCVMPPRGDYRAFHRHLVETSDGPVWTGRITTGGRHPGLSLTAAQAIGYYDDLKTVAYVRAFEDEFGLGFVGILAPDVDDESLAILDRKAVSGDWRETADGLSLVEVLALSPGPSEHSEPGFPIEVRERGGRQLSLVASFSPPDEATTQVWAKAEAFEIAGIVRTELARRDLGDLVVEQARNAVRVMLDD